MMKNNPLVSIITLTFNHEKYIADCILSVQAQTYPNWEMLIIDDGSSDHTLQIAQSYAKDDKRIIIFARENIGVFRMKENYNFALEQSHGKYIALLDGDDVWLPKKLELQIPLLENEPTSILAWSKAYSCASDLHETGEEIPVTNLENAILENNPVKSILRTFVFYDFIPALTIVIRKDALEKIGGFFQEKDFPTVDFPTLCRLAELGSFEFIPIPLGKWRLHISQTTKKFVINIAQGHYNLALKTYNDNIDFFNNNTKIKLSDIHKFFNKKFIITYSRSGRYKLIEKDFKSARKDYRKSIFNFGFYELVWKLRSIIGLILSFFHTDVEALAKFIGHTSYK